MEGATLAAQGISILHARYADVASRMAWGEMRDLVLPDARFAFDLGGGTVIELVGPEQVAAFGSKATANFAFYSYQPLNSVITRHEESSATGRFYALEVAVDRATGNWLEFYGFYDDEYALRDGSWWFAQREFRTLAQRINEAAGARGQ